MTSQPGRSDPKETYALPPVCTRCLVRGLLRALPIPLVVTDGDGRVLLMNEAAERLLGRRETEALFRSLQNSLGGLDWGWFWQEMMASSQARWVLLTVGSPPRRVEVKATPFLCPHGTQGFLFLFTQPLEEQRLYQQLLSALGGWAGETGAIEASPRLSPREQKVIRLLAEGLTNRDIAQRLQISTHTVDTHVRRIYRKLGIHSRAQAAAWVARNLGR